VAPERLVHSRAEAERAFAALDGPVALKICSARLPHKTEAGGVVLNLADATAAGAAYAALAERFAEFDEGSGVPMLVQQMVRGGVETIAGLSRDPQWGAVIAFGLGGVLVEIFEDARLALPPLDEAGAEEMLATIGAAPLLRGYRGTPPRDRAALRATLLGLSRLALDLGDLVAEVDVNPLLALPEGQGACAVDALMRLQAP
jgi:acyl-CoA synthetase (NDP forming)